MMLFFKRGDALVHNRADMRDIFPVLIRADDELRIVDFAFYFIFATHKAHPFSFDVRRRLKPRRARLYGFMCIHGYYNISAAKFKGICTNFWSVT